MKDNVITLAGQAMLDAAYQELTPEEKGLPPERDADGLLPEERQELVLMGVQKFRITNTGDLDWYGRKQATIAFERDLLKRSYQAADNALKNNSERLERFFGPQAEQVVRVAVDALNGRGKSIKTLAGTFGFRTVSGGALKVVDPDEVLAWARNQAGHLIKTQTIETVPFENLTAHLAETGESIPGTIITEPEERFYYQAPKKKEEKDGDTQPD